jgi:hypothetical protein
MTGMTVPVTNNQSPSAKSRPGFLVRALRSAGFGAVFGVVVWALRGDSFWYTMAYSLSIALSCWFAIDSGRLGVARWIRYKSGAAHNQGNDQWPGWGWMIVIVVVGGCVGFSVGTSLVNWMTGETSPGLFDAKDIREGLSMLLMALVPALMITYFFYSRGVIADREAATLNAQRQAAEHQLKLLESQLEPHMLFNTLANLRVLIGMDPARAQAMLDQLIAFLRATLDGSRASSHPISSEFARLADYLALMQVRMGERLQTNFELPAALADVSVPPMLLQPLVENSIKHGLEPSVAGGRIEISAAREAQELVLSVRDTGVGLSDLESDSSKFGLVQVRERLATLYGAKATLSLSPANDAEGGTLATIRVPWAAS